MSLLTTSAAARKEALANSLRGTTIHVYDHETYLHLAWWEKEGTTIHVFAEDGMKVSEFRVRGSKRVGRQAARNAMLRRMNDRFPENRYPDF